MKKAYNSRYSDKPITAAQYAAELVCENIAETKKQTLTVKFWNLPAWQKVFVRQVQLASALIQLYGEYSVIQLLRTNRRVVSLAYKKLDCMLQEIENKKTLLDKNKKIVKKIKTEELPRPGILKKNLYSKLDDI